LLIYLFLIFNKFGKYLKINIKNKHIYILIPDLSTKQKYHSQIKHNLKRIYQSIMGNYKVVNKYVDNTKLPRL